MRARRPRWPPGSDVRLRRRSPCRPRPRPATERLGRGRGRARSGCGAPRRARRAGRRTRGSRARPTFLRLARLDGVLQARARAEARHAAGGDLDPLARLRVHTLAGATVGHRELAEAREVDLPPTGQRLLDDDEDGVDGVAGLLLPETRLARYLIHELLLSHVASSLFSAFQSGRTLTTATDDWVAVAASEPSFLRSLRVSWRPERPF